MHKLGVFDMAGNIGNVIIIYIVILNRNYRLKIVRMIKINTIASWL